MWPRKSKVLIHQRRPKVSFTEIFIISAESKDLTKIFVFVGDKQSGKSSLILKFLELQTSNDKLKNTVALDFKYATKNKEEKRAHVHTYEVGGGRVLVNMLQATFSLQNLSKIASICIVLDLSKPGNVIDSLTYWLNSVKEHLNAAL